MPLFGKTILLILIFSCSDMLFLKCTTRGLMPFLRQPSWTSVQNILKWTPKNCCCFYVFHPCGFPYTNHNIKTLLDQRKDPAEPVAFSRWLWEAHKQLLKGKGPYRSSSPTPSSLQESQSNKSIPKRWLFSSCWVTFSNFFCCWTTLSTRRFLMFNIRDSMLSGFV